MVAVPIQSLRSSLDQIMKTNLDVVQAENRRWEHRRLLLSQNAPREAA